MAIFGVSEFEYKNFNKDHNELKNEGMILLTRRKNLKIKRLALSR